MDQADQLAIFNKPDWLTNFRNAATAIMTALAVNGATAPSFSFSVDGVPCCITPLDAVYMRAQIGSTDSGEGWQVDLTAPGGWFQPNPAVSAPWDLSAAVTPGNVQLTWHASNTSGVTYNIYRDEVKIATVAAGTLTYDDETAVAGSTHVYTVRADNASNVESADSAGVTVTAE